MIGWHYLKDCFSTSDISISSDSLFAARSTSILVFVSRSISSMVAFLYKSFIIIPTNHLIHICHCGTPPSLVIIVPVLDRIQALLPVLLTLQYFYRVI